MKTILAATFLAGAPLYAWAADSLITVTSPWVALAPPSVKSHAAYLDIRNDGLAARHLVGVKAEGYGMAHLHHSMEKDGVAMMHSMDQMSLDPGQEVSFAPGGLHIMLMMPMGPKAEGDMVDLTLIFADGEELPVVAVVRRPHEGS
ncbi:MAG: copper chaperone PCu(A)C [Mangrovicoccus sp.]